MWFRGQVFGSSFNTNGLGGVLTCGVTGVKAGLSHAPVSSVCTSHPYPNPNLEYIGETKLNLTSIILIFFGKKEDIEETKK